MRNYFDLTHEQKVALFTGARGRSPWGDRMLEKDLWLVWVLDVLFKQPNAPTYSFKGGTSLSKVYDAIHRFSEDVDVTIDPDHSDLTQGLDPTESGVSKTQLKSRGELARAKLPVYLKNVLAPYLEQAASELPSHSRPLVEFEEHHPEQIRVHYPSVFQEALEPPYIPENVLLEFGVRASTEPSVEQKIDTYLSRIPGFSGSVALPSATTRVMALERTFWEKVTLIHFENTRNDGATPKSRYARHWYDLHQISLNTDRLTEALAARDILQQVIRIKHVHYSGKGVSYSDCGAGRLRLVPGERLHALLATDFEAMQQAAMFVQDPPAFAEIAARLGELETEINERFAGDPINI